MEGDNFCDDNFTAYEDCPKIQLFVAAHSPALKLTCTSNSWGSYFFVPSELLDSLDSFQYEDLESCELLTPPVRYYLAMTGTQEYMKVTKDVVKFNSPTHQAYMDWLASIGRLTLPCQTCINKWYRKIERCLLVLSKLITKCYFSIIFRITSLFCTNEILTDKYR